MYSICVYIHTFVCVYVCVHVPIRVTHPCACFLCISVRAYVHLRLFVCVCLFVCVHSGCGTAEEECVDPACGPAAVSDVAGGNGLNPAQGFCESKMEYITCCSRARPRWCAPKMTPFPLARGVRWCLAQYLLLLLLPAVNPQMNTGNTVMSHTLHSTVPYFGVFYFPVA